MPRSASPCPSKGSTNPASHKRKMKTTNVRTDAVTVPLGPSLLSTNGAHRGSSFALSTRFRPGRGWWNWRGVWNSDGNRKEGTQMDALLDTSAASVFFDGLLTEPRLDHPEGLAVHKDGSVWCGG